MFGGFFIYFGGWGLFIVLLCKFCVEEMFGCILPLFGRTDDVVEAPQFWKGIALVLDESST